ncbi:putative multidrug resistance ABC transporter ATP-binding/permease protein YheI [Lactobacillus helveticus]|uniref:Multidrug resistance ABC transporter ATP-binding/permease protein YheI n=1 Tax=Lactobacillus helveticus TaxID=1587 RepID=A0A9Q5C2X0_LACHE|nr:putative multidrug resistance ABC transporter ATP-binding/permease protein YheI [Lactobacillus helveticus]NRN78525.1 putative multidrug resistance ABC transporter ATP-binding/permease protein YheI [Lactobacillus helveticus]NRN91260.1 putative multidrug resistance ABC transporter ATP-binding/permease protein YheI [Lactobacillus helveticus]NRN95509.1 putative multidrug resistance ABC transporter ATP-binding/permease protein YheI [Lactobacillus helveticus]NRO09958.1 putative multidrug resistanc
MKKLHSFQHYFKLLLSTYKLFFKAAPIIATFVALLAPIQAIASVVAINAGQNVINEVTAHKQFWTSIGIWIIATALTQLLPPLATSTQGILTDKLTGFINVSLMKKSKDLQSLSIFDNNAYFDDLQLLKEGASWRPVNLIVFGVAIIQSALTLIFMLSLLAKYNLWIALLLLLVMVPQSLSYYQIQQQAFETMVTRSKNARKLDYLSSLLLDRKDAKEVRLFNMFPAVINRYIELFKDTRKNVDQVRMKQMYVSSFFLGLVVIVSGYGFFWFASSVSRGLISAGALLMFISVIASVSSSLATLVEDSSLLYDSLLWVEKYNRFEKYHDNFQNGTQKIGDSIKQIKLSHVSFTYPFSNEEVLHDINFSISRGEKIAIVSENGSGKSTLIKLLMRFYDPSKGEIDLNGSDLKDYDIKNYRDNLSATFQDYSKFKLSLFENVSVFRRGNNDKVKSALNNAGLESLLKDKDIDLNTILSKEFAHGIELSGGQWQKIALARDIYSNAQVEFLDEPTAAIDAKSENEIYKHFLTKNKGKTIVFVTHRLSAVKYADKILFL